MADMLHPQKGARPWHPAGDVTPGEVLHEYDVPLVGLIDQAGYTFMYGCLVGEAASTNVWAYSRLEPSEVEDLLSAGTGKFDEVLRQNLSNRPLVMAIAFDWELADWTMIDAGEEDFLIVAERFISRMRKRWDTARARTNELEERAELVSCQ